MGEKTPQYYIAAAKAMIGDKEPVTATAAGTCALIAIAEAQLAQAQALEAQALAVEAQTVALNRIATALEKLAGAVNYDGIFQVATE